MPGFLIPLHPKVVHFPIALFVTAFGLEVLSLISKKNIFHQCAVCSYVLAAFAAPLVVRTGLWEEARLKLHHPLLEQHEAFALWTMWTSLISLPVLWLVYRKSQKVFRIFFILCLMSAVTLVALTADKGGDMVYKYGVGVEK